MAFPLAVLSEVLASVTGSSIMDFTEILNLYRKQLQENLFYRKRKNGFLPPLRKNTFLWDFFFVRGT